MQFGATIPNAAYTNRVSATFVCPRVSVEQFDGRRETDVVSAGCAKGILVALGLEAAAALCVYAAWHAYLLIR